MDRQSVQHKTRATFRLLPRFIIDMEQIKFSKQPQTLIAFMLLARQ